MNVLKRLFNIFSLISFVIFFVGLGNGVSDYRQSLVERDVACQQAKALDRAESALNPPFRLLTTPPYFYIINGKKFETDEPLTQAEFEELKSLAGGEERDDDALETARKTCSDNVPIQGIFNSRDFWLIPLLMCFFVIALNYVLFGRATIWNRIGSSQKE